MNQYMPVVTFARDLFESSDEETNVIEKIENFFEQTVPNMNDKQFKTHFRMNSDTFQDLLNRAGRVYRQNNTNVSNVGRPRTDLEKELLVLIWCLANLESFR